MYQVLAGSQVVHLSNALCYEAWISEESMWARRLKLFERREIFGTVSESPWICYSLFLCRYYSDPLHRRPKLAPLQERRMIDSFKLHAKGGDGGSGCYSVRRSRSDRRGRPDGGNGGRGGDVILECSPSVWDFSSLHHHAKGSRGGNGTSKNKIGTRGRDKVVYVPLGTVIHLVRGEIPSSIEAPPTAAAEQYPWDLPGSLNAPENDNGSALDHHNVSKQLKARGNAAGLSYTSNPRGEYDKDESPSALFHFSRPCRHEDSMEDEKGEEEEEEEDDDDGDNDDEVQYNIAELKEKGERIIVAYGGEGGLGNVSFSDAHKDETSQSENDEASSSAGSFGLEATLLLELKSIADVGLVGMPNAGKSTLLGAISRAKPAVGHYAFTTLRPNLGNLNYDDFSITVADIPGLIKGAHKNRGLGHAFLRHIERTKVLAFVVDLAAALDGRKGTPPWEQLRDLILELEFHQEGLSSRPSLVVANKVDENGAEEVYQELRSRVKGIVPIYPVCAVLEEGIPELKDGLRKLVSGDKTSKLTIDDIQIS